MRRKFCPECGEGEGLVTTGHYCTAAVHRDTRNTPIERQTTAETLHLSRRHSLLTACISSIDLCPRSAWPNIMAGNNHLQPTALDEQFDFSASDLSKQFEQLLRTRRLNELEEQARPARSSSSSAQRETTHSPYRHTQSSLPAPTLDRRRQQHQPQSTPDSQHRTPPKYTSHRNVPLVPCAPQDAASLKFRNLLLTLSVTPTKYENPGLLDEALTHIPIDRIYQEAEEEHNIMKGMAASIGENVREDWGYQDCVIRSLLR